MSCPTKIPLWVRRCLGGRPMHLLKFAFTDIVSRESVYYYMDCYGRRWMAANRWGWFRVPCEDSWHYEDDAVIVEEA